TRARGAVAIALALGLALGGAFVATTASAAPEAPEARAAAADVSPTGGAGVIDMTGGYNATCGIKGGSLLECWGDNTYGQTDPPSGMWSDVALGMDFGCAIGYEADNDGPVQCWGGDASTPNIQTEPSGTTFDEVEAGSWNACARKSNTL